MELSLSTQLESGWPSYSGQAAGPFVMLGPHILLEYGLLYGWGSVLGSGGDAGDDIVQDFRRPLVSPSILPVPLLI